MDSAKASSGSFAFAHNATYWAPVRVGLALDLGDHVDFDESIWVR